MNIFNGKRKYPIFYPFLFLLLSVLFIGIVPATVLVAGLIIWRKRRMR